VLFGDSHAAQWFTPVAAFATSQDAVLTTVLKSSCPPAAVDVVSSRLRRIFTECLTWRVAALEQIRALHPDLVIISEHSLSYVRRPDFEVSAPSATPDEWRRGLQDTVSMLRRAGIATVVIADTPLMESSVPTCLGRAGRGVGRAELCGRERRLAYDDAVTKAERTAIAAVPGARYIEPGKTLCPTRDCEAGRGDLVLYRDANHISEPAARSLIPVLAASLAIAK
jgi:hypothetical protein